MFRLSPKMKPSAEGLFSDTAVDFDSYYGTSGVFKERYQVWTALMDKYLIPPGKVLDLGCGSGIFSFYLASKGFKVTGVDGAVNMIELCRQKQQKLGFENAAFILSKIPLEESLKKVQFEYIISSSVLEYIEDLDQVLQDVYSMLKPGGIFMVSMPNRQSWYRKFEQISLKLINRPIYLKYVHHIFSPKDFNAKLTRRNLQLIHSQFYAGQGIWKNLLPVSAGSTLFISVFKKPHEDNS
jgi:2-polyprenyl-3-methyl-5-hydroxy-6-metoxy-1,4-benzoquinol methylase